MSQSGYEELVENLIQTSSVVDHSRSPCEDNFIPDTQNQPYVIYIRMDHPTEYTTWKELAKVGTYSQMLTRQFLVSFWLHDLEDGLSNVCLKYR